jgi:hypothetical protein
MPWYSAIVVAPFEKVEIRSLPQSQDAKRARSMASNLFVHDFRDDLVPLDEFGIKDSDRVFLGISCGFRVALEDQRSPLKKELQPPVKDVGAELELIAQIGDGHLFDEMSLQDDDLFLGGEMPPFGIGTHGIPPLGLLLTQPGQNSISV